MRIDRTNLIEQRSPGGDKDKHVQAEQPGLAKDGKDARMAARAATESGGTAAISPAKPSLVRQAAASPEVNAQAVADARRLLQAGQLDTPEAARAAAEAILTRGL